MDVSALSQLCNLVDYIYVDLDDTLKPSDSVYPEGYYTTHLPRWAEIVALANSRAIPPIALCTGRELPYVLGGEFRFLNAWSIIEGGVLTCNLQTGATEYHININSGVRKYFRNLFNVVFPKAIEPMPDLTLYSGKEINIAIQCRNSRGEIALYQRHIDVNLRNLAPDIDEHVESDMSSIAIDYRPLGVNKGTAFQKVCEVVPLDPSKVLSIGDSHGDFPIMSAAGFIGCPSNATEECKEFVRQKGECGKIADYPFLQGVIQILEHFAQLEHSQQTSEEKN